MTNPYTYLFYILFKLLDPIVKEKDRLPFGIISIIGFLLLIHTGLFLIILKSYISFSILPNLNPYLIGGIITLIFYFINNYFYEKDDKYIDLINKMSKLSKTIKIMTKIVLLIYFLLPLILYLIKK